MISLEVVYGLLLILMLRCACNSITYNGGIPQPWIEYIVGVVQLFETIDKVEETPKCVLRNGILGQNEYLMLYLMFGCLDGHAKES